MGTINLEAQDLSLAPDEERYSVHINCGGPEATIGNTVYGADDEPGGAAKYVSKREDWQTSTTGHIWDVDSSSYNYKAENMFILRMDNSVLYTNARFTPLSLTYHVRCLVNGNYTIKLHFAEIVMRDNRSYYSLGRRIFDVYIQDIVVLKDFYIVKAAGGVDKVYIHNYTAPVTNGALEIRLHWAGKGTTRSPTKGTYGPLISAIDVESDFKPPTKGRRKRFIVAGAVGVLSDGTPIAVKQLSAKSKQGNREFVNEIGMISALEHPNLVTLGYMAPEYALYGYLTYKADVYSFGVVALEIVSGMNNVKFRRDENFVCLLDWVLYLQKDGDIMEIVDPRLGSEFNKKEVIEHGMVLHLHQPRICIVIINNDPNMYGLLKIQDIQSLSTVCGPANLVNSMMDLQHGALMLLGPTMNAKVAFELSERIPHLGLRMKEHCHRAMVYATKIKKLGLNVIYPGLEDHRIARKNH
uniref:non-specific serine/threonine protein kinase n=1 Tax=Populus alba TaxID=43335 RepID=A0A4U5QI07_POPAL|nr:hypothetical protein D5086_0000085510 [Populus alba]